MRAQTAFNRMLEVRGLVDPCRVRAGRGDLTRRLVEGANVG